MVISIYIYIGECVCILPSISTSPSVVQSWPNLAHTHADSPRKGSGQNKNLPLGGFRGSEIEKWVKSAKRLDRLAPNLAHICGFIWERTWAKKIITPSRPQGAFWGVYVVKKLKPGKCGQTAGLIGTNCGALMQIHLERVVGPKKLARGIGVRGWGGWGVRNSKVRKSTCEHTHAYSSTKGSRPIGGGEGG